MPTLLILFGLRFFFYSENHEPMHVHVQRDNNTAKFDFFWRRSLSSIQSRTKQPGHKKMQGKSL